MGFRDDREAARLRADALEQDLQSAERELVDKDRELEAMRGELAAARRGEVAPPPRRPFDARPLGLVTVAVAIAGLGAMALMVAEWSSQLVTMTERMVTFGRGRWVGAMNLFNQLYAAVFTLMALALAVIGVGQIWPRPWHPKASILWGWIGVAVVVADVIVVMLLQHVVAWDAVFTVVYPLAMIVMGRTAQRLARVRG